MEKGHVFCFKKLLSRKKTSKQKEEKKEAKVKKVKFTKPS